MYNTILKKLSEIERSLKEIARMIEETDRKSFYLSLLRELQTICKGTEYESKVEELVNKYRELLLRGRNVVDVLEERGLMDYVRVLKRDEEGKPVVIKVKGGVDYTVFKDIAGVLAAYGLEFIDGVWTTSKDLVTKEELEERPAEVPEFEWAFKRLEERGYIDLKKLKSTRLINTIRKKGIVIPDENIVVRQEICILMKREDGNWICEECGAKRKTASSLSVHVVREHLRKT